MTGCMACANMIKYSFQFWCSCLLDLWPFTPSSIGHVTPFPLSVTDFSPFPLRLSSVRAPRSVTSRLIACSLSWTHHWAKNSGHSSLLCKWWRIDQLVCPLHWDAKTSLVAFSTWVNYQVVVINHDVVIERLRWRLSIISWLIHPNLSDFLLLWFMASNLIEVWLSTLSTLGVATFTPTIRRWVPLRRF